MEIIKPEGLSCITIYKVPFAEIEKLDFAQCAQPTETLEHFYNRQEKKPKLLFNGGFFDMDNGKTVFSYVDEGEIINLDASFVEGIGIKNNRPVLDLYNPSYKDFISGYPVLMNDGIPVNTPIGSEINYKTRRTVMGYDEFNFYMLIIEKPGYNFRELQQLLSMFNIPNAINLDGGGSTRVLVDGVNKSAQTYSRPVDNVIAVYLKDPVIYRVQTGAFTKKANAEAYKKEIQNLTDTIGAGYKNAYVRIVDGLYKVQVGAFSVKANAERVLRDLQEKGYNSFITTL